MKYVVIDYFDVWFNDEEGYFVNDLARTNIEIEIADDDTHENIISKLISAGYLAEESINCIEIEWYDEMCELFDKDTYEPICRLEKI